MGRVSNEKWRFILRALAGRRMTIAEAQVRYGVTPESIQRAAAKEKISLTDILRPPGDKAATIPLLDQQIPQPERVAAALEAAGVKPKEVDEDSLSSGSKGPGAGQGATAPPPPQPSPDDMVVLAETAVHVAVKAVAATKGIPMSDDMEKLCKLSDRERSSLRIFAPYAARYFNQILENMDKIGAGAFCVVLAFNVADRVKQVERMAPKSTPAPPAPPIPRPSSS